MEEHIEVPLTRGYVSLISVEDADLAQLRWHARVSEGRVYAARRESGRDRQYLHRLILERKLGCPIPSDRQTDHKNRDTLDNQRENLRSATPSENSANRERRSANTGSAPGSLFRGVFWHKRTGKWYARIKCGGKNRWLGTFDREEEAARAYDRAALVTFGGFAILNNV